MEKRLIDYKDLSKKDKIDHIWEYYKLHMLAGLIAVGLIFGILNHYVFNPPAEVTLDITVFGSYADMEVLYPFQDAINEVVIEEGVNEEVYVEFFDISNDTDPNTQQATVTKMAAKAMLHDFDIMIFANELYEQYLLEDVLLPLDDYINKGQVSLDESAYIYGGETNPNPDAVYVLDISDHVGFRKMLPEDEHVYFAISATSEQLENIDKAIEYVLIEFNQ